MATCAHQVHGAVNKSRTQGSSQTWSRGTLLVVGDRGEGCVNIIPASATLVWRAWSSPEPAALRACPGRTDTGGHRLHLGLTGS